jgi:hypothetical protein
VETPIGIIENQIGLGGYGCDPYGPAYNPEYSGPTEVPPLAYPELRLIGDLMEAAAGG